MIRLLAVSVSAIYFTEKQGVSGAFWCLGSRFSSFFWSFRLPLRGETAEQKRNILLHFFEWERYLVPAFDGLSPRFIYEVLISLDRDTNLVYPVSEGSIHEIQTSYIRLKGALPHRKIKSSYMEGPS